MSHDINADPELWELREEFGDRAGFVWLEILSISDRNDGLLGPDSPQLRAVLASKCRVYSPKVHAILDWCLTRGWLELKDGLRVANYWKYHRTREPKEIPTSDSESSPPNLPNLPNLSDPKKTLVAFDSFFSDFWKKYPKKVNKQKAVAAWHKIKGDPDLAAKIMAAVDLQKQTRDWKKEGGRFIPHASSWLNGRRWEDDLATYGSKDEPNRVIAIAGKYSKYD